MKFIIAVVLIAAGGWLIYSGYQRQESMSGSMESLGNKMAGSVDGKARVAQHTWYYVGGGGLAVLGLGALAMPAKK
ncbi:DUF3185 family protein [Geminisphaera colitermitum]|uniref:DUF3185 family protein n=1 Tax=Geminisphaera colitermitum TaxID=1148786 RepID=UPI0001964DEC|nr:DUF3185 family protein [Geminisphaera colitermitum]